MHLDNNFNYLKRLVSSSFAVSGGFKVDRMAHMFDMRCCASAGTIPCGGGNIAANEITIPVELIVEMPTVTIP